MVRRIQSMKVVIVLRTGLCASWCAVASPRARARCCFLTPFLRETRSKGKSFLSGGAALIDRCVRSAKGRFFSGEVRLMLAIFKGVQCESVIQLFKIWHQVSQKAD